MGNKKIAGLLAIILFSGCAEIKRFPRDFKEDVIGISGYYSCTNRDLSYYHARTNK